MTELKLFAKNGDADLLNDIDNLIREKKIKPKHGVSLITSSNAVLRIYKLLIRAMRYFISNANPEGELNQNVIKEEVIKEPT